MADTAAKITALETKLFGDDPLKQRGVGSQYEKADEKDKALLDALYALQAAENAVGAAEVAREAAKQKVAEAQKSVDQIENPPKPAAETKPQGRSTGRH